MPPDLPERVRNRQDLEVLLARATNYEELKPRSPERPVFKLDRVADLLASVGDPQGDPRVVHVAGSKGKGSVARMVEAAIRRAVSGPVGLFTSPHLEDLSERIAVNGKPAANDELARAADRLLPHVRRVHGTPRGITFFELLTGMAWLVFRERGCTDVVLETGLGGRLDATNVCAPALTLITAIELEHTEILGPTVEAVAAEKAGILKPGVPAGTTAERGGRRVIEARAAEVGASLAVVGRDIRIAEATTGPGPETRVRVRLPDAGGELTIRLPLAGLHQTRNAALAAWAAHTLRIPSKTIVEALEGVRLPGVIESLGGEPAVIVDAAHTPVSAAGTRAAVEASWPGRRLVVLLAMLQGKDVEGIANALLTGAEAVVATELPTPRTIPARELAAYLRPHAACTVVHEDDPTIALDRARQAAGPQGIVLVTGSVRIAGLIRTSYRHPESSKDRSDPKSRTL